MHVSCHQLITWLMSHAHHTHPCHTLITCTHIHIKSHAYHTSFVTRPPKAESHTKIHHIMRWVIITTLDGIHVLEYSCNGLGVMWSYPRKVLDLPLTVIQTPMLIVWVLWDTRTMWTSISTISTYTIGLAGRKPKKRHKSIHTSAM